MRIPHLAVGGIIVGLASHLIFQPFYILISVVCTLLLSLNPGMSRWLWSISPAHWCEFAYVPLPGLKTLLLTLYHDNARRGISAIAEIKIHPFYAGVGKDLDAQIDALETAINASD
jgi:hypothetical protein